MASSRLQTVGSASVLVLLSVLQSAAVTQTAPRLSVCHQDFVKPSSLRTIAIARAGLPDAREGDGIQVGLRAQPLARLPLGATSSVLRPRRGEGAGQADGGRQA